MLKKAAIIAASLWIADESLAAVRIRQWNANITSGFVIDEILQTVRITASNSGEIYKFEAYDDTNDQPVAINSLVVDTGVGGTVRVLIDGSGVNGRSRGATDVKTLNLSEAATGTLEGLDITADLGETSGVFVDNVAGAVQVDGEVFQSVTLGSVTSSFVVNLDVETGASITASGLSSLLHIKGQLKGSLNVTNLSSSGTIDLGDTAPLAGHPGTMNIYDDLAGTIRITRVVTGNITVDGNLTGLIELVNLQGRLEIQGDINGGRIFASGLVQNDGAGSPADLIRVTGSIVGSRGAPLIEVGGLTNTIGVDGCLANAYSSGPEIKVGEFEVGIRHNGAVSIDYNGGR